MGIYDNLNKFTGPALLQSALNIVTANVDKREGSVIYDTLAPLSVMTAGVIQMMKTALENTDIQTATGEWLDLLASQPPVGIYRNAAIKARKLAVAAPIGVVLSIGTRYQSNSGLGAFWRVIEPLPGMQLNNGEYLLECETAGDEYGGDYGELTPEVSNVELVSFSFVDTAPINAGSDEESDFDFRLRIWEHLKTNRYGGNFADYMDWCLSEFPKSDNGATLDGMMFYPSTRYLGGGSIKICPTLTDSNGHKYNPASTTICNVLKAYLDPQDGSGEGVSPVGHRVDVEPPRGDEWNLSIGVVLKPGYNLDDYVDLARTRIEEYFELVRSELVSKKGDKFPNAPAAGGYKSTLYIQTLKGYLVPEVDAFASVTFVRRIFGGSQSEAVDVVYEPDHAFSFIPMLNSVEFVED